MKWRISEPAHLLHAVRLSLHEGGRFLRSRLTPNGPILEQRLLSYVHKTSWGMYAAGVEHGTIARLLDWALAEALQPNGDFYFPEEGPEYRDYQRVYRPLNFLRIGCFIGHPIVRAPGVIDRVLQYQHEPSGGVFNYIGDDPKHPEPPPTIGVLNSTFFGRLMIELDLRDQARAVADWICRWVDANRPHLLEGRLYAHVTPEGQLVTEVEPGERIWKVVDYAVPRQEFWNPGVAIAYLAFFYDTMRSRWDEPEERARPYLDACMPLLDFDDAMPLDTYLWPSKCKAGWGAGELMRVLVKYGLAEGDTIEKAYRVAERTAMFTFMDNQLPSGGWPAMQYPLSDLGDEMQYTYKPLKHMVAVPPHPLEGENRLWLPGEEITGEFLGEMKAIEEGVAAWLGAEGECGAP